ncbi:hypothetical protein M0804_013770 [Polistes exclamans]|nr:hypothetical protein M0804_013770 [Polistes exclamans]
MERNNIKPLKIVNNGNSFIIQNTEIGQPSTEKKQTANLGRTERRIIKINDRNSRMESEMDTDSEDSQNWLPAKSTKLQNSRKRKISEQKNNNNNFSTPLPAKWLHNIPISNSYDILDESTVTQNTTGKAVEEKKAVKPPPIYIDVEIIDPLLELLDETIDHSPIIITYQSKPLLYKKSPMLCNGSTNWMIFKETLESKLNCNIPLKTSSQIDNAVNNLTDAIQEAAWASTSQKVTSRDFPTYPSNILHKIKIKRQVKARWQKNQTKSNKRLLNKVTKDVKQSLRDYNNAEFEKFITSISPHEDTNYSLWKTTKRFKRPIKSIPAIRNIDGSWAKSTEKQAETFAINLEKIFTVHKFNTKTYTDNNINDIRSKTQHQENINNTTAKEIRMLISQIKSRKAPGYDLINGRILKELPPKAIRMLTIIYNAALRVHYFPSTWKLAEIIMLPKPNKDPHDVNSYRPISLLPLLSKLLEKKIFIRMKKIISAKNLIPNHQFGFRNKHSTVEQVHRLTNTIITALENKEYCSAFFIDIEKAFDKVWHQGLLQIINKHFPYSYFKLLKSYLSDRTFYVKIKDNHSNIKLIKAGVPQGSILGPILYTLYTADIPINDNRTVLTFADDTAMFTVNKDPQQAVQLLQNQINSLEDWLYNRKIKVNCTKCKHITFTLRRGTVPKIQLYNTEVPQTSTVKYLGLHLDSKLTWKKHISAKIEQIRIKRRQMAWLTGKKSKLSIKNKLLIYKTIIKPIWTYGLPLWGIAAKSHITKLEAQQSITLRTIVNAPWYIHNEDIRKDLNIPTIEEITKSTYRYKKRIDTHMNPLANNNYNQYIPRRLKRIHPRDLVN